jgi:hypothetical protein
LSGNGVTESRGNVAAVRLILDHFKDDFIHGGTFAQETADGQGAICLPVDPESGQPHQQVVAIHLLALLDEDVLDHAIL